jgi:hypothetical protein
MATRRKAVIFTLTRATGKLYRRFHLPFEILTNDKLEAARTGNAAPPVANTRGTCKTLRFAVSSLSNSRVGLPNDQVPAFEARERAFHGHALCQGSGFLGECFGVDADGKRADLRPAAVDLAPIAAGDSARIGAHDAASEITGVGLGLKTNNIIGSKRAQDSLRRAKRWRNDRGRFVQKFKMIQGLITLF